MSIKIKFDVDKIAAQFKEFAMEVEQDLVKSVANLAAITHAKVSEMAQQELHSTRKDFMNSLEFEEIVPGVWVVSVDEKGLYIEEGIEANKDMKPDLLKRGAKTSKDGHKYKSIPFDYGKYKSHLTPYAQGVVNQIKQNLRKQGILFRKIEFNKDGSPRTGKLHSLDFGGEIPGKGNTPVMKGVSIYQSITKRGSVRRDILTFRTVSSGPASEGKWIHPGLEPKHFLDKAAAWAMKEWEDNILPEILNKWK